MTIEEARIAAGLTPETMNMIFCMPEGTTQVWELGVPVKPAWAESLILAELSRIQVRRMGGETIKRVPLTVIHTFRKGLERDHYAFDFSAAQEQWQADESWSRRCTLTEYTLDLPDDYPVTTAEQLMEDLLFGRVEADGYDRIAGLDPNRRLRSAELTR